MPNYYTKSIAPNSKTTKASDRKNKVITLDHILGGPPRNSASGGGNQSTIISNLRSNSELLINISPALPVPNTGLSLFSLSKDAAWKEYQTLLNDTGFEPSMLQMSAKAIQLSCIAENFPTDSFTNEYGDHFLNQIADVASSSFGQLAQMMGKDNATDAAQQLAGLSSSAGKELGGMPGQFLEMLGSIGSSATGAAKEGLTAMKKNGGLSRSVANTMESMLAGARVDFPMIWKSSSYSPAFSCSVRLYNPNPKSDEMTKKYIIGPLAAILTMALPRAKDLNTYQWPFFCIVDCPGLFNIPMGAISNISISKGGEAGLVAYNQRIAMVDIKMDFVNLHSILLLTKNGAEQRPTLKGYLNNLLNKTNVQPIYLDTLEKKRIEDSVVDSSNILNRSTSQTFNDDTESDPTSRTNSFDVAKETALELENILFYQ